MPEELGLAGRGATSAEVAGAGCDGETEGACTIRRMITVVCPVPAVCGADTGTGGAASAMDAPMPNIDAVARPATRTRLACAG